MGQNQLMFKISRKNFEIVKKLRAKIMKTFAKRLQNEKQCAKMFPQTSIKAKLLSLVTKRAQSAGF